MEDCVNVLTTESSDTIDRVFSLFTDAHSNCNQSIVLDDPSHSCDILKLVSVCRRALTIELFLTLEIYNVNFKHGMIHLRGKRNVSCVFHDPCFT